MKKIYETKVTSIGGREGEVFSPDHSFAFKTTAPGKRVENATNRSLDGMNIQNPLSRHIC